MNVWLLAGGAASAAAAVAHLCCIAGGERWYRAMGAGERMTRSVARGERWPHMITAGIALMLASWAAYALSGAGVIAPLPMLRPVLGVVTGIYLLRAFALPILFKAMPDRSSGFLVVSSLIVLVIGGVHLVGLLAGLVV